MFSAENTWNTGNERSLPQDQSVSEYLKRAFRFVFRIEVPKNVTLTVPLSTQKHAGTELDYFFIARLFATIAAYS